MVRFRCRCVTLQKGTYHSGNPCLDRACQRGLWAAATGFKGERPGGWRRHTGRRITSDSSRARNNGCNRRKRFRARRTAAQMERRLAVTYPRNAVAAAAFVTGRTRAQREAASVGDMRQTGHIAAGEMFVFRIGAENPPVKLFAPSGPSLAPWVGG